MTGAPAHLALDAGTAAAKLAFDQPGESVITSPAPGGDWRVRLTAAFTAAGLVRSGRISLTVPEAWLDASVDGTAALESLRQACEELGIARVTWVSQLAAVAALAAQRRPPGCYLVCDIGAAGVRTAAVNVTGPAVQIMAAHSAAGGGWRDFDASVRARFRGGEGDPLPADWHQLAASPDHDRRARILFGRVAAAPGLKESPLYTFTGPHGECHLLTGEVIDCFAPTRERIQAGVAHALAGRTADVVVLTGGLGWLPLAQAVLAEAAGAGPVVEETGAAARGALLFAQGTVHLAWPGPLAPAAMPAHRLRNGELEEVSVVLPWTEPFASPDGGPVQLEEPELTVDVAGRRRTVPLPGLVPGPCLVGVRPGWSGSAALVVRPADGGAPIVAALGPVPVAGR